MPSEDRHMALAKVAYEAFNTGFCVLVPWDELPDERKKRWRRVAKVLRFTIEDEG